MARSLSKRGAHCPSLLITGVCVVNHMAIKKRAHPGLRLFLQNGSTCEICLRPLPRTILWEYYCAIASRYQYFSRLGMRPVALSVRDFESRLPRWSMAENNLNITDFRLDRKLHYVQDLSITVERLGCPGYWRRIPSISGHKSVRTGSVSEGVVCQRSEPRKFDGSYAARRSRYDCHIPGDDNHG